MKTWAFFSLLTLLGTFTADISAADQPNQEYRIVTVKSDAKNPHVTLTTNKGVIEIELFKDKAPISTENFLTYLREHAYDHTIFHRVINGFMIQGGGFTKGLAQKNTHDPIKNEADNGLKNSRGTLAMARTNVVDSATNQFFINLVDNEFLNHRSQKPNEYGYAVFGKVTKGMDIVDAIAKVTTTTKGPYGDVPVEDIEIIKAEEVPQT